MTETGFGTVRKLSLTGHMWVTCH